MNNFRWIVKSICVLVLAFVFIFCFANWSAVSARVTFRLSRILGRPVSVSTGSDLRESFPYTDRLSIPSIGVFAPIVRSRSTKEEDIQVALRDGIVLYPGTADMGQRGASVLFGHTSYYSWQPGGYKSVFALLDELNPGDTISTYSAGHASEYSVIETRLIEASDLSILRQSRDQALLILVGCWPLGTNARRLIVTAQLSDDRSTIY